MKSNSVTTTRPQSNFDEIDAKNNFTMKENFQRYQTLAIKLHLQSEQCPMSVKQQKLFERQQSECLAGQAEVIKAAAQQTLNSIECAKLTMSLWMQEVVQGQDESDLSDTDRMALKVFEFFNKHQNDR